jgi:hypothetical protein
MTFKPSATYQRNLRNILDYYTSVDPKLGKRILDHLDRMKTPLTFPFLNLRKFASIRG